MSPSTIIRLLDVLGENHDQKVIEWRDDLFQTLDKLLQVCVTHYWLSPHTSIKCLMKL